MKTTEKIINYIDRTQSMIDKTKENPESIENTITAVKLSLSIVKDMILELQQKISLLD